MSSLIDTDLIIDGLHSRPDALTQLERLAPAGIAVSIISLGELYEGAYLSLDPAAHLESLREFLAGYRIVNMDDQVMKRFAQNAHLYAAKGS